MHINYHRGENRELAWRNQPNHAKRHYGQSWRRTCVAFKYRKATCDLEEPRHKPTRRNRKKNFVLYSSAGLRERRYANEEAARQAMQQLRKGWWGDAYMWVERVA